MISRLNDVKYGAPPPSASAIEDIVALAEKLGLDTTQLKMAIEAADKVKEEGIVQTKVTPANAVKESEKFFKSPEMQHVLNMQEIRSKNATFEVNGNGNPPGISQKMAISEAETIDQNYLASQRILKELEIREQEIFNGKNLADHEAELDKILTQRTNHAKLQANHEYRRETNLTNDQLYANNEIGSKTTQEIAAKELAAEMNVMSRFEERMNSRKKQLGISSHLQPPVTRDSFKDLAVEHVDRGALVTPRSTPNISQARSRGMSI